MNLSVDSLIKPIWNPRKFSEESRKALRSSIDQFGDISGITWNKRTGNVVAGNHRLEELYEKYGKENISFQQIADSDFYMIMANNEFTTYILREVDWEESKEKMANVVANSQKVMGEFTAQLNDILDDIQLEFDDITFKSLRLDELNLNISELSDLDDSNKITIRQHERDLSTNDDIEEELTFNYKIEIDCETEEKQKKLYQELVDRGLKIRLLL